MRAKVTERHGRLRVGVTGHRVLADIERIVAGVREAVELIQAAYPGRQLIILSALAEGADRLVVQQLLNTPSARLWAVLPFDAEEYAQDFGPPGSPSRAEFQALLARATEVEILPPARQREDAYARAGEYVLERCDVLLAVWDGRPGQGRGGTGEVVTRARVAGKPLVIVGAGNRRPGTSEPTTLGTAQGRVASERLPCP